MKEALKKNKGRALEMPLTNYEKGIEVLSGIGILLIIILVIAVWNSTPERIPTHYALSGIPDTWGKKESLLFIPMVAVVLYIIMSIVTKYPHTFSFLWKDTGKTTKAQYQSARHLLVALKAEIILSFAYIQWITIQVAFGKAEGLGGLFFPLILIIVLGTVGIYFFKSINNVADE